MPTQTIATLTVENQTFYDRTLLERQLPELHLYKDAKKKMIPNGKGTSIEWRKFGALKVPTQSLTEGVTPAGSDLDITAITATLRQEGDFVRMSDVLEMAAKDPVITEASELLGEQSAQTLETRIIDAVTVGTNVQYANGKTSRDAITITDTSKGMDVKKAVRTLRKCNIKPFSDGYYHAYIDAEQGFDLMNDTEAGGWLDANKYTDKLPLLKGEIGKYGGVRFMESSLVKKETNAGGVECHLGLIYGKDSYGVPEIEKGGAKAKVIVKAKGSAGSEDPLDQRSSVGWKSMFTAKILEQLGIVRLETAVSN